MSYTERLISHLTTKGVGPEVIADIREFAKTSYTKPEEKECLTIPFGKYKDKAIADVAVLDKPYLQWLSRQGSVRPFLKTALEKYI